jgi:hypothetical protein
LRARARELAAATLEKTQVRAPFDGIVVLKDAEVGEVVSPNVQGGSTARGSVATDGRLVVARSRSRAAGDELVRRARRRARQHLHRRVPDQRYAGHVRRVWPTANRQKADGSKCASRSSRPTPSCARDGRARRVRGPSTRLERAVDRRNSRRSSCRSSAIVRVDGKEAVFVLERDIARLRRVTLGGERSRTRRRPERARGRRAFRG